MIFYLCCTLYLVTNFVNCSDKPNLGELINVLYCTLSDYDHRAVLGGFLLSPEGRMQQGMNRRKQNGVTLEYRAKCKRKKGFLAKNKNKTKKKHTHLGKQRIWFKINICFWRRFSRVLSIVSTGDWPSTITAPCINLGLKRWMRDVRKYVRILYLMYEVTVWSQYAPYSQLLQTTPMATGYGLGVLPSPAQGRTLTV